MKKFIILFSMLLAVILISGCAKTQNTPTASTTNNANSETVNSDAINIQNFSFSPATLTVKTGTTVTWTNNDSTKHRISSDTFNSSDLNQGQSYQFKFENLGTYDYICGIHPSMKGKIIVE